MSSPRRRTRDRSRRDDLPSARTSPSADPCAVCLPAVDDRSQVAGEITATVPLQVLAPSYICLSVLA
jgi:hypothetical protein